MRFHFFVFIFSFVGRNSGNPHHVLSTSHIKHAKLFKSYENFTSQTETDSTKCTQQILDTKNITILKKGEILVKPYNATTHASRLNIVFNGLRICFLPTNELKVQIFKDCGEKWYFDPNAYKKFPNGSVEMYGEQLQEGTYDLQEDGTLVMCSVDYDKTDDIHDGAIIPPAIPDDEKASSYIGKIGSSISILAILAHIFTFCSVPSLRNLPGKNLVSLSVAFLLAYSFLIIGQIPKVIGTFCVVSAILQHYFFLVSFFWMNVMAFDVWKTLKMATERLVVSTETARRLQFLWYSLYAWLVPLKITVVSVVIDKIENAMSYIKPHFGRGNICWMSNEHAKAIFFMLPAFTLFLVNLVFFIMAAFILKRNTMKNINECEHKKTAKLNYILYVRLATMMGVTWLIALIAYLTGNGVVWYIFDVLNSLQGLFVFLLFTCSRKVFRHVQERTSVLNRSVSRKSSAV